MLSVSIIIPTLNEAAYLARTLRCLAQLDPPATDIIVVDGGSVDDTLAIAQVPWVKVLAAPQAMRSVQMNLGAQAATGEVLCFLHADTLVPDDLIAVIESVFTDPNVICGAFISVMTGPQTICWGVTLQNFVKTYWGPLLFRPHLFFGKGMRLFFGDQAIFCRQQPFWDCGGFDVNTPVMEESDFCQRITHHGRMRLVNRIVQASDRRVAHLGPLKANTIYLTVGILWAFGVPATVLKRLYAEIR
jgi:rSAM/selenodomain-associated transferase 2